MSLVAETDLAWLAGIVDGEGCFSLKRPIIRQTYQPGKRTSYQLWLVICNTSKSMIDRISKILDAAGVEYPKVRKVWKGKRATRWQYWIHVQKKHALLKITEALLPHLTAKRTEAEVVAWFLRRACRERCYRPTQLDVAVLGTMSQLKKNGGEAPADVIDILREVIPNQADSGTPSPGGWESEGVETRAVSSTDNPPHECPTPQFH
jgi:hypothetical protein